MDVLYYDSTVVRTPVSPDGRIHPGSDHTPASVANFSPDVTIIRGARYSTKLTRRTINKHFVRILPPSFSLALASVTTATRCVCLFPPQPCMYLNGASRLVCRVSVVFSRLVFFSKRRTYKNLQSVPSKRVAHSIHLTLPPERGLHLILPLRRVAVHQSHSDSCSLNTTILPCVPSFWMAVRLPYLCKSQRLGSVESAITVYPTFLYRSSQRASIHAVPDLPSCSSNFSELAGEPVCP